MVAFKIFDLLNFYNGFNVSTRRHCVVMVLSREERPASQLSPSTSLQVHLMYQRLPATVTPSLDDLSGPVLKVIELVEEREEYEMADLSTGQYLVCAEVRLGNTSLQSDCFQAEVDSPLDVIEDNPLEVPVDMSGQELGMIVGITAASLVVVGLACYSVFWLVVTNRRRRRER